MDNKKLGVALMAFCIFIVAIFLNYQSQIRESNLASCNCEAMQSGKQCPAVKGQFGVLDYGAFAIIFTMLALGIYLTFFEKGQKEIIKTLEHQKRIQTEDEKFAILSKAMDHYEKKVLNAIREQPGITQSTLRYRTDLSKSKLSTIISDFEKKGLVKRVKKGKTQAIFLKRP